MKIRTNNLPPTDGAASKQGRVVARMGQVIPALASPLTEPHQAKATGKMSESGCLPAVGRNALRCRHVLLLTKQSKAKQGMAWHGMGSERQAGQLAWRFLLCRRGCMPAQITNTKPKARK